MAWLRDSSEPDEREPVDIVLLVVGILGVAVVGTWAQAQGALDGNLFRTVNDLPGALLDPAKAVYALGSIWVVLGTVVVLAALRRWKIALHVVLAGVGAWAVAAALNEVLGPHPVNGLGIHLRTSTEPTFASTNVAAITALAVALGPYLVRPLRRIAIVVILAVALASMYLGAATLSDAVGGMFLGLAAGAAVLVAFGTSGGRPSGDEVREALEGLGVDLVDVRPADEREPRVTVMHATTASGEHLRVDAYGRDQRDGQIASKLWRGLMYREPARPVFGTRLQQVEHVAFTLMLAERGGVAAPRSVKTGMAGPDAAVLLATEPGGLPLDSLPLEQVTDALLGAVWDQVGRLHRTGVSHGNLVAQNIRVGDDGGVCLRDFAAADASADRRWLDRDIAAVVVETALIVGNDRAAAAAIGALGRDRLGEVVPVVQPAALPAGVGRGTKHLEKVLKALRVALADATGAADANPLKIKRLSLVNIGMLIGVLVALVVVVPSVESIDFASVQTEFADATWGWIVAATLLYPLILTSEATALIGANNAAPPLIPTVIMQLATKFLGVITPDGIGGVALQVRYFNLIGVPVASATSAMVLSSTLASLMQLAVLIPCAALSSTSLDFGGSGTAELLLVAVVAAGVGVLLLVPKLRGKVLPVVKRALTDLWAVIRDPHKAMKLFGGNLGTTLAYPVLLGMCLLAFGQSVGYAELFLTQVGAGMLSSASQVPGGVGVQEAALTGALTGFGVPANAAVAGVLTYRCITFTVPVLAGYPTLIWLRRKGYA